MSLGEIIHAYSYTYSDQLIDGLHAGSQQSIVPPHLIDFNAKTAAAADDADNGPEHDNDDDDERVRGQQGSSSSSSSSASHHIHGKRNGSIQQQHERALQALRRQRRRLARQVQKRQSVTNAEGARSSSNSYVSSGSSSSSNKRKRDDKTTKPGGSTLKRPSVPAAGLGSSSSNTYTPPTAASFYIPKLPGLPSDSALTLYGGHLPSTITASSSGEASSSSSYTADGSDSDAHLFFFLAKAKHIAEKQKLVIWLNGGPGCSSFDGALMEIGPLRMVEGKKGELFEQEGGWNEYANVMFIDQPAGTGYSYVSKGKYVKSGEDAARHVVTFLRNFYDVFPEYEKMDTYIAGESFAGIWIPYLANELGKTNLVSTPLKGLLIGNGWIDPYSQYPAYVDFAYQEKLLMKGTTAAASLSNVDRILERCNKERERIGYEKFPINHGTCEGVLSAITETTVQVVNGKKLCVNNYDIRLTDTHPACGMNWPNLLPDMYEYLPRQDVVDAFHASARKAAWAECNGHVSDNFWGHTKPSVHLLPSLLESGLPVLLFSGMQDLICNHVGTEKMIDNLSWSGAKGWGDDGEDKIESKQLDWWVDGTKAGTWRTARNLTYVQVYNSSHMVPFDVPIVAHDMLSRFIGTDYFIAAGASAKVPSRIGNEQEAIIGETHLNGSALDSTVPSQKQATGLDEASSSTSANPVTDAYYNIGAALLVLFVIILIGVGFIWRQRRRRSHRYGGFGSGGSKHGSSLPTTMSDGLNGHLSQHRRNRSSASDYRRTAGDAEEASELLPMDQKRDNGEGATHTRRNDVELPRGEELFSVGEEDEIDSEEEGNIGRPGRKLSAVSS